MITFDHFTSSPLKTDFISIHSIMKLFSFLKRVNEVAQQRYELKKLDARMLNDIGITKEQAQEEAQRDIWDISQK